MEIAENPPAVWNSISAVIVKMLDGLLRIG